MRIASRRAAPCRLLAVAVAALTPLSMADLWHARAAAGAPSANYAVVSDAAVVAGLRRLVTQATEVAAKTAAKDRTAKAAVAAMYDTWFTFEGTVRKKDQSLYLDMEDTLAGERKIGALAALNRHHM